jgi:hypothetical protein
MPRKVSVAAARLPIGDTETRAVPPCSIASLLRLIASGAGVGVAVGVGVDVCVGVGLGVKVEVRVGVDVWVGVFVGPAPPTTPQPVRIAPNVVATSA